MGFISTKGSQICCLGDFLVKDRDYYVDSYGKDKNKYHKIVKMQSVIRGFLLRNKLHPENYPKIKEISMDYSTDYLENNPRIVKLNNLLPKFELSEKETYEINNSNLKIMALLYPNKAIYKGMINEKGLREGFGKLYLPNGSIYKGFFKNNLMQGRGRMLNMNGFVYDGEFNKGLSEGYGKYIALDGTTYKGTWARDKQNGFGDESYPDGSRFIGSFKNGKKNGQGKLIFNDQNIFEGSFVNNEIKGEGTYHWKDGRIYIGGWDDNKMEGYGIFLWPDKKKYYGHYSNNVKEGFGIFYWNDGHKFEGFWKDGKQHGFGIVRGTRGSSSSLESPKYGQWFSGKFIYKIEEDNIKKKIIKLIENEKNSEQFLEFNVNIERYEKYINDTGSGLETGVGSVAADNKCCQIDK